MKTDEAIKMLERMYEVAKYATVTEQAEALNHAIECMNRCQMTDAINTYVVPQPLHTGSLEQPSMLKTVPTRTAYSTAVAPEVIE